jgi:hypothetical protein
MEAEAEEEKMPGRFAEGPRSPGFILPASAVSEQENRSGSRKNRKVYSAQGLYVRLFYLRVCKYRP